MKCSIEKHGLTYQAVVVQDGRPRVTTRVTTLTRKGAEKVLAAEGCGGFGSSRKRRKRRRRR